MVNDIVADLITRIRNANCVKAEGVLVLRTKLTVSIVKILKEEGFIDHLEEVYIPVKHQKVAKKYLLLSLKYKGVKQKPYITALKRISKPGLRVYVSKSNIPKVLGGIGIAVISTSKGIMTGQNARRQQLGGEVLCKIW